ncbi:MAG TPA: methyltransferase domain-containing protein [Candidatus Acidoferrum sp.]|nr:methyltransferase domain-containing protein [Candidatus Acidoferrum sp.]
MNYEEQKSFLKRQHWRLVPSFAGCAALLGLAMDGQQSIAESVLAAALALALAWAAYYLPQYLGLDADPWRRLYWFSRARWVALFLLAIASLLAGAKLALGAAILAALLHLSLLRILLKPERQDLRESIPARLSVLALLYGASDLVLLWLAHRGGVSSLLLSELLLCFVFLFAVIVRPRLAILAPVFGIVAASLAFFFTASGGVESERVAGSILNPFAVASVLAVLSVILGVAVFFWMTGTIYLLIKANQHNLANYDDLLDNLQQFLGQSRKGIVDILLLSVPTLAENWRRAQPQGQEAVAAWYSANAHLYLLANCQHHLLYRHMMYTFSLLKIGRGRVLDYGGGNGDFSRALARRGFETTYLDVPGDAARYVKWRAEKEGLPLRVVLDRNALEGPYDVIFCLDVVEHLVDLPPVFEHFRKLLKPGGKLLATYYNGITSSAPMHIDPGYDAKDFLLKHGFRDVKSTVVSFFSPELMQKNHFMILEKEGA